MDPVLLDLVLPRTLQFVQCVPDLWNWTSFYAKKTEVVSKKVCQGEEEKIQRKLAMLRRWKGKLGKLKVFNN